MTIKKADLYEFLERKENEIRKEKLMPLRQERIKIENEAELSYVKSKGWTEDKLLDFANKAVEVGKIATEIKIDLDSYWGYSQKLSNLLYDTTSEQIVQNILNNVSSEKIDYGVKHNELSMEIIDLNNRINDQFTKLVAMVKSNTAKNSLQLLEEMGFDMTEIKKRAESPKMEIKALDIDTELMGLPEKKAEPKKAEETANENHSSSR